jgi:hypothetical protein
MLLVMLPENLEAGMHSWTDVLLQEFISFALVLALSTPCDKVVGKIMLLDERWSWWFLCSLPLVIL